jgi:sulfate adenylyltransferase subunit 2
MHPQKVVNIVREKTDTIILFHSGTGKDSICLCDLLSKNFARVVCVFMYMVKDLEYENRYIKWAKKRYNNVEFYQTPHFSLSSFIKHGHLGIQKDLTISLMSIGKIDKLIKVKFGIRWSVYGFKKNDGITRRLMLNGYTNNICDKTSKAYPLADWSNKDVLRYIQDNDLIQPFIYNQNKPSSGCDISEPTFLDFLRRKYPEDLQKVISQFPTCEVILFKYDSYGEV